MESKHLIIFIAGRIRNGAYPRIPNFSYNEDFGKYLYLGRSLTPDEFNAAAETILDQPEKRFSLSVRIVDSPGMKAAAEKPQPKSFTQEPSKS